MEQNLPVMTRRIWSMMRVIFFMLRKGISKSKIMLDLNLMMKRGKIAGKAIGNLMFHHSTSNRRSHERHLSFTAPHDYEFSCSNSPASSYYFPFHVNKRKNNNHYHHHNHHYYSHFFSCTHASPTDDDEIMTVNALKRALEMLNTSEAAAVEASPILPGFGRSPMVRQLRITDSPFPLQNVDEDNHVDQAAEEFIAKFYNELKKQKIMTSLGSY